MSDELDYYVDNTRLRQLRDTEGLDVEMLYDGVRIPAEL
jgi:hypothetical protein